jgi:hypothetical protein
MNNIFRNFIVDNFGFLIPINTIVTSTEFANLIRDSYDITTERNLAVYEYLLSVEFHVSSSSLGITVL